MWTRISASERTRQKPDELLIRGVADGDARAELLKLALRKIVEEALEAQVADAVGGGAARGVGGADAMTATHDVLVQRLRQSEKSESLEKPRRNDAMGWILVVDGANFTK